MPRSGDLESWRWVPFRHPVARDWSFWLAWALALGAVLSGFLQHEGPWTILDAVGVLVMVTVFWFLVAFVVGLPVALVRQFRAGYREGRAARRERA